jgi:hypothetical protein
MKNIVAKKRATEWGATLTDEMIDYAKLHGVEAEVEFESWRDYHLVKGTTASDWFASWRTWCRNAEKFKNEKRQIGFTAPRPQPAMVMKAVQENEEIAREVANMTPEQRATARARLREIWASIK